MPGMMVDENASNPETEYQIDPRVYIKHVSAQRDSYANEAARMSSVVEQLVDANSQLMQQNAELVKELEELRRQEG